MIKYVRWAIAIVLAVLVAKLISPIIVFFGWVFTVLVLTIVFWFVYDWAKSKWKFLP